MNFGLFAMLAGFLLPLALILRLGAQAVWESYRGWSHPVVLALTSTALLTGIPVVALIPSVLTVCGRPNAAGALLLEYAGTGWGTIKLALTLVAVLFADIAMPRVCAQLVVLPTTSVWPSRRYLLRDVGMIAILLIVAWLGAR
ncbi:hypothetical protein [Sphingomonas sp. CROZ-RG-20F-R02-07]|uniref:hypothetical protein n=1 Tax=Sphingomonas sp. CROZ-RG-20F-R02-07 TaxID=2914832 RepID=UPI001F582EA9|nr:hypothetical protein [Sphingomonas sp. CROZ-RG-20F-R02-07]